MVASVLTLVASALAFNAPSAHVVRSSVTPSQQPAVVMMAKGFGKVEAQPKAAPKKKAAPSAGAARRDQASADLEKLKKQGNPEYTVCVREVPEGGTPGKWLPVGGMAVPRSSSIDVALSIAIFNNEEDLLKGAYRTYPYLKNSETPLEYGYRLAEFADDPVKVADKSASEPSDNPLLNWFNTLDNPLNDGSGWFNPLDRFGK